ncbi:MAG: CBS domain-containing protein [Bacteroidota bacterium]
MTNQLVQLSDIMTTDLITVSPNDTMERVNQIFKTHSFHHLPVVEDNQQLVGLVSKSDYLVLCDGMMLINKKFNEERNLQFFRSLLVKEIMVKQLVTLQPEESIMKAVDIFKENYFHAIPIVNQEDELKGLVTTFDLLNHAFATA